MQKCDFLYKMQQIHPNCVISIYQILENIITLNCAGTGICAAGCPSGDNVSQVRRKAVMDTCTPWDRVHKKHAKHC